MIINETESRNEQLISVARAMMSAARTAPKGCGVDNLEIAAVTGARKRKLVEKMREVGEAQGRSFFLRDSENVESSEVVVLIGAKAAVRKLNCGLCGYPKCRDKVEKAPETPCSFDVTDLGIAVGSAVSIAADFRVDNRIMYSAGVAARELGYLGNSPIIFAIPLSATGKSIYFDRQHAPTCAK